MKHLLFIAALTVLVSACSSEKKDNDEANVDASTEVAAVIPNRVLTMEIDGMVCEMGCGGSIRKELKNEGGVARVEFDFEDERATNIAKISFDKNAVTVDELINAVTKLNNGQFTVGETNSENLETTNTSGGDNSSSGEESSTSVSVEHTKLPNLLDLLSGLLN